jgi:hypothetical protein
VTNLLLHVINVLLVFWVACLASEDRGRQAGQRVWREGSSTVVGFATAALLAVHPMMTQAVGYISGRSEVAYSTFFLLAFLAGRRWMLGGGKRWWFACFGLWVIALLTKESAVMLPVVLLAYDWLVLDAEWPERRRRLLRLAVPMLAATLVAGAGRVGVLLFVEYPDRAGPDWRFAVALQPPALARQGLGLPHPGVVRDAFLMTGMFNSYSLRNYDVFIGGERTLTGRKRDRGRWVRLPIRDHFSQRLGITFTQLFVMHYWDVFGRAGQRKAWPGLADKIRERHNRLHPKWPVQRIRFGQVDWPQDARGYRAGKQPSAIRASTWHLDKEAR